MHYYLRSSPRMRNDWHGKWCFEKKRDASPTFGCELLLSIILACDIVVIGTFYIFAPSIVIEKTVVRILPL